MKKILFSLIFLPTMAIGFSGGNAAITAALTGAAVSGTVLATQAMVYQSLMSYELTGWTNQETGKTIELDSKCNINAEFHLLGNHSKNALLIGISNSSEAPIIINYSEIEFLINDDLTRFPRWLNQPSDQELKNGWWQINSVAFPNKSDFKNAKTITAKIPVYRPDKKDTCLLTARFTKTKKVATEEQSYTAFELSFEGGPSLLNIGASNNLGKGDSFLGMNLNFFASANHGGGFGLTAESSIKNGQSDSLASAFKKGSDYEAQTTAFVFNYVYRHYFNERFTMQYEPGIGWQDIKDKDDKKSDKSIKTIETTFIFQQKIMFNWNYLIVNREPVMPQANYFLGVGLIHTYTPHGKIGGMSIEGNRVGGLIRVGFGF